MNGLLPAGNASLRPPWKRGGLFLMTDSAELRLDVPKNDLAVLDGYCMATGRSRADVVSELLGKWSSDKSHEAIVVCRVAGINPTVSESERK